MESGQSARQSGSRWMQMNEHFFGRKRARVNMESAEERTTRPNRELPEDIIETIFGLSGFPGVMMAKFMSTTWADKFKSVAGLKDEVKKDAAMAFQNQISKRALTWKISYPIVFCEESCRTVYADPLKRKMMPLVSFPPKRIQRRWNPNPLDLTESRRGPVFLDLDSALLLMSNRTKDEFYVVNILTRSFKVLPPCPKRGQRISLYCSKLLTLSDLYKVVIFSKERPDARYTRQRPAAICFVQIYDSSSQTWSHHNINPPAVFETVSQPVFIGGVLYMVIVNDPARLGALDLASYLYVELRLRQVGSLVTDRFITAVDLSHSNDQIMILVTMQVQDTTILAILEVDLGTQTVTFREGATYRDTPGQRTPAGRRIRFNTPLSRGQTVFRFSSGVSSANVVKFYGDVHRCPFLPGSNLFLEA